LNESSIITVQSQYSAFISTPVFFTAASFAAARFAASLMARMP